MLANSLPQSSRVRLKLHNVASVYHYDCLLLIRPAQTRVTTTVAVCHAEGSLTHFSPLNVQYGRFSKGAGFTRPPHVGTGSNRPKRIAIIIILANPPRTHSSFLPLPTPTTTQPPCPLIHPLPTTSSPRTLSRNTPRHKRTSTYFWLVKIIMIWGEKPGNFERA